VNAPPAWRPSAPLEVLRHRARMLAAARACFAEAGVLEVETPLLSRAAVTDVHLESVPAEVGGQGRMFLHTSPEYPMKRLLAAGLGDCYQVCHVFRDGERGPHHNPEFTMIEWYRVGFDAARLMDDVETLVGRMLAGMRELPVAERIPYRDAVRELGGADPMAATADELAAVLGRHGVGVPPSALGDRDALLDLLVSTVVGPRLGRDRPVFVHDYPASQAALARIRPADFPVAERFELYLDGLELANGFHELAVPGVQRRRFEADLAARASLGRAARPVDERFLAALAHGLPDCSGVALGFDRLVMAACGLQSIDRAMAFPVELA
jgi:lysyl-tRNA synthetase class 2